MRHRTRSLILRSAPLCALAILIGGLSPADLSAAPITTAPLGSDLDGDGHVEVEGSTMSQNFAAVRGEGSSAVVSFSFMFLTSEASARPDVHDLFRIRLRRANANSPTTNTFTGDPAQVAGSVVRPGDSYTGSYDAYDFANGKINGDAATASNIPLTIPAGGMGLSSPATLSDGGIGWQHVQFRYAATSSNMVLEFLVADSLDDDHDSALLIANVEHQSLSAWPASIGNGQFTAGDGSPSTSSWSFNGNFGVYDQLTDSLGNTITAPAGDHFAVLSTSDGDGDNLTTIPEPTTGLLLLTLATLTTTRRRRRH